MGERSQTTSPVHIDPPLPKRYKKLRPPPPPTQTQLSEGADPHLYQHLYEFGLGTSWEMQDKVFSAHQGSESDYTKGCHNTYGHTDRHRQEQCPDEYTVQVMREQRERERQAKRAQKATEWNIKYRNALSGLGEEEVETVLEQYIGFTDLMDEDQGEGEKEKEQTPFGELIPGFDLQEMLKSLNDQVKANNETKRKVRLESRKRHQPIFSSQATDENVSSNVNHVNILLPLPSTTTAKAMNEDTKWNLKHRVPRIRNTLLFQCTDPRKMHLDPPSPPSPRDKTRDQRRLEEEFEQLWDHLYLEHKHVNGGCMEMDFTTQGGVAAARRFLYAQAFLSAYFLGKLKYARQGISPRQLYFQVRGKWPEGDADMAIQDQASINDEGAEEEEVEEEPFDPELMREFFQQVLDRLSGDSVRRNDVQTQA